jgi:ankyrin repeat protein
MRYDFNDYFKSGEFWRLVIDGPKQQSGRLGFNETNYTQALIRAARHARQLVDKKLALEDIFALHTCAVKGVHNTGYGARALTAFDHSHRAIGEVKFSLAKHNSSKAGMTELLRDIRDQDCGYLVQASICTDTIETEEHPFSLSQGEWLITKELLSRRSDEEIKYLAHKLISSSAEIFLKTQNRSSYRDDLAKALSNYHQKIAAANALVSDCDRKSEKLKAIAWFCREGARIHPFEDGNGRVFCMLLPYLLCLQQGFPIPLLRDPNLIGNHALNEIVAEMQDGFLRTGQLLTGEVPDDFPTRYTTKHSDLADYYEQLLEAIDSTPLSLRSEASPPYIHQKLQFHRLCHAIYKGNKANAIALLNHDSEQDFLYFEDPLGNNALLLAIKRKQPAIANHILARADFDVTRCYKQCRKALALAIIKGYDITAHNLIERMPIQQLNLVRSTTGMSALMLAIKHKRKDIAERLPLPHTRHLMRRSNAQDSVLEWAIFRGCQDIAIALMEQMTAEQLATCNPRTKLTPLHLAIKYKQEAIALKLVKRLSRDQLQVKCIDTKQTALAFATEKKLGSVATALAKKIHTELRVGILSRNSRHIIYHYAKQNNHSETIAELEPHICRAQYWYDIAGPK